MDRICMLGDHHNAWSNFESAVIKADLRDTAIFHLGDGGYGFGNGIRKAEQDYLLKQNSFLASRNCILYNIRGNHDNPYWFMPKPKLIKFLTWQDNNTPSWKHQDAYYILYYVKPKDFADFIKDLSHLKFVEDYSVVKEAGYNVLCIGGAISVDRVIKRSEGKYFEGEVLKYDPHIRKITGVDIVATHTTPDFAHPQHMGSLVMHYTKTDRLLYDSLIEERMMMGRIYKNIREKNNINYFIYGHYHVYHNENIDGTDFICLQPNQLYELPPKK